MTTLKSANVTKYDAGGSGDNVISDGYIKSVEKVWVDSYTLGAAAALGSDDSIAIGRIPKGKKLQSITVFLPVLNPTATTGTVFLDTGATMIMTAANTYLGAMHADGIAPGTNAVSTSVLNRLHLQADKHATEAPADLVIYMKLVLTGGGDTITTAATIRSIIKYT